MGGEMDGWVGEWIDSGWMNGWTGECMGGEMDGKVGRQRVDEGLDR